MTDNYVQELNEQPLKETIEWIKSCHFVINTMEITTTNIQGKNHSPFKYELKFNSPDVEDRIETLEEIRILKRKLETLDEKIAAKKVPPPKEVPITIPQQSPVDAKVPFMANWKFIGYGGHYKCWKCKKNSELYPMYEHNNGLSKMHMCVPCQVIAEQKGEEPPIPM